LASCSKVPGETLAKTFRVVADTSSRTISSLIVTVSLKDIRSGWAFLKGAIWTSESSITQTSDVFVGIPNTGIRRESTGSFLGKNNLSQAHTSSRAVIWTDGSLTGHTFIVIEALALTGFSVADTLVGTFDTRVGVVKTDGWGNPCDTLWTCS
jgi:hypothetical protein